jgi:hypothetical protein
MHTQVVYSATLAPNTTSRAVDDGPEVTSDTTMSLVLIGCPPTSPAQPSVAFGRVTPVTVTNYTWEAAVSVVSNSSSAGNGGGSGPMLRNDQATQMLLDVLTTRMQGGGGRRRLRRHRKAEAAGSLGFMAADRPDPPVTASVGRSAATSVPVRADFSRKVAGQEFKLNGTVAITNLQRQQQPKVSVSVAFADGTGAQVAADCPAAARSRSANGSPAGVNCTWQLAEPLKSAKSGVAVALIEGQSPAATSKPAAFNFDKSRSESSGGCAAVTAAWSVEGSGGGSSRAGGSSGGVALPQPKASGQGAAPSSAVQICEPKSYSWQLSVGPFSALQCTSDGTSGRRGAQQLLLVGAASAVPTSGGQAKQAVTTRSPISLSGCPAPATG